MKLLELPQKLCTWRRASQGQQENMGKHHSKSKPQPSPSLLDTEDQQQEMLRREYSHSILHRRQYRSLLINQHKKISESVECMVQASIDMANLLDELREAYAAGGSLCCCFRIGELRAMIEATVGAYQRRLGQSVNVCFEDSTDEEIALLQTGPINNLVEHARRFSVVNHDLALLAKQHEFYENLSNEDISEDIEQLKKKRQSLVHSIENDQRKIETLARRCQCAVRADTVDLGCDPQGPAYTVDFDPGYECSAVNSTNCGDRCATLYQVFNANLILTQSGNGDEMCANMYASPGVVQADFSTVMIPQDRLIPTPGSGAPDCEYWGDWWNSDFVSKEDVPDRTQCLCCIFATQTYDPLAADCLNNRQ